MYRITQLYTRTRHGWVPATIRKTTLRQIPNTLVLNMGQPLQKNYVIGFGCKNKPPLSIL